MATKKLCAIAVTSLVISISSINFESNSQSKTCDYRIITSVDNQSSSCNTLTIGDQLEKDLSKEKENLDNVLISLENYRPYQLLSYEENEELVNAIKHNRMVLIRFYQYQETQEYKDERDAPYRAWLATQTGYLQFDWDYTPMFADIEISEIFESNDQATSEVSNSYYNQSPLSSAQLISERGFQFM